MTVDQDGVAEVKFANPKPLKEQEKQRNCCKNTDYQAIPEKWKTNK